MSDFDEPTTNRGELAKASIILSDMWEKSRIWRGLTPGPMKEAALADLNRVRLEFSMVRPLVRGRAYEIARRVSDLSEDDE